MTLVQSLSEQQPQVLEHQPQDPPKLDWMNKLLLMLNKHKQETFLETTTTGHINLKPMLQIQPISIPSTQNTPHSPEQQWPEQGPQRQHLAIKAQTILLTITCEITKRLTQSTEFNVVLTMKKVNVSSRHVSIAT